MESNWAAEHLQVIRTLMERSAVYRRALAPIMTCSGLIGAGAGAIGWIAKIQQPQTFVGYWAGVGVLALASSFLLVRRQALKESEPFWSPPTRRVGRALLPALFAGSIAGLLALAHPDHPFLQARSLPPFWMILYGCALNAAGFFMHRGIKLLGWLFIASGCALLAFEVQPNEPDVLRGHLVMGAVFGGLHLAYGIYLYFTEQSRNRT